MNFTSWNLYHEKFQLIPPDKKPTSNNTHFNLIIIPVIGVLHQCPLLDYLPVGVGQEPVWLQHADSTLLGLVDPSDRRGNGQTPGIGDVTHSEGLEQEADCGGVEEKSQDHDSGSVEQNLDEWECGMKRLRVK